MSGFGPQDWEERYRAGQGVGQEQAGPALVAEVAGLAPGTALDAGCGRGADARWLASRGWDVTAVDVSATAVAAAARPGDGITWVHADLLSWEPGRVVDLVASSYVHVPVPLEVLLARLAGWVAPGGTLLVVGHAHDDAGSDAGARVALAQLTGVLTPSDWHVEVAEPRRHAVPGHGTRSDVVVRARRRS